jgi:AraC family transcriptional regulator
MLDRLGSPDPATRSAGDVLAATAVRPDGPVEMARILDVPPVVEPYVLRGDTRLTRQWVHGGLHDYMRGMSGHVVVGCFHGEREISWRVERKRFASRTQRRAFTLIPEGHDGRWDIEGKVVVSHAYLTQRHLQACADEMAGGRKVELQVRVAFEDPAVAGLLDILSHEAANDSAASRLFVEHAIDLLCLRLIRGHSSIEAMPLSERRRGLADWQVRRVTAYMRGNLARHVGLDELAAVVGLSRFHFCTAFRQATGVTPHRWLTMQRMERARDLLRDRALSVTDVAFAVGYETPSAFAAIFRRSVGTTPTAFRRGV